MVVAVRVDPRVPTASGARRPRPSRPPDPASRPDSPARTTAGPGPGWRCASLVAATPLGAGWICAPVRAQRRAEPVVGAFDLLTRRAAELGGEEQLSQHGHDRRVVGQVGRHEPVDECRWRRVRHEPAGQLGGDVAGGGGVPCQEADQRFAVALGVRDAVLVVLAGGATPRATQDRDRLAGVGPLAEPVAVPVRTVVPVDRPAGQHLGHAHDVGLVVDVVPVDDAERVQLEQLTAVVLVDLLARAPVAHVVVEVHEHRGALGRRHQQVGELPERVGPHDPLVVGGLQLGQPLGATPDVQVVGPEVAHDLVELPLGVDRPQQRRVVELGEESLTVLGPDGVVLGIGRPQRRVAGQEVLGCREDPPGASCWSSHAADPIRRACSTVAAVAPKVARSTRCRASSIGPSGATVVGGTVTCGGATVDGPGAVGPEHTRLLRARRPRPPAENGGW